jgi:hypothetical protein
VHHHGLLSAHKVDCAARVLWQVVNESDSGVNDKPIVDGVGARPILLLTEIRPHSCTEPGQIHAAIDFELGSRAGPAGDFRKSGLPAPKYQRRRIEARLMP